MNYYFFYFYFIVICVDDNEIKLFNVFYLYFGGIFYFIVLLKSLEIGKLIGLMK